MCALLPSSLDTETGDFELVFLSSGVKTVLLDITPLEKILLQGLGVADD